MDWEGWDVPSLRSLREQVDTVLREILATAPPHVPQPIRDAMVYATVDGGKRLRALLLVSLTEAMQGPKPDALLAAAAVEMVHAASLVLDDLPCMDDAKLRRGHPAVHLTFGEDNAILTAFSLINLAYEVLARLPSVEPTTILQIIQQLAWTIGRPGLITGQWQDLHPSAWDEATVDTIHLYKTAVLFEFVTVTAGLLSRAGPMEIASLRRFGTTVGRAFQCLDDILDVYGEPSVTGKDVRQDVRRLTYWKLMPWDAVFDKVEHLLDEAHRIAMGCRWASGTQWFLEPMMVQLQLLRLRVLSAER
ncbi:MAG: polyprenyl synthetase family protein [Acidobacteriota bacterium]|nr:polyprenyl synthetase family protein [Acidobacteriota bacterium]